MEHIFQYGLRDLDRVADDQAQHPVATRTRQVSLQPAFGLRTLANRVLWLAGILWTAPNTLIGILLGLPALAFGAKIRFGYGAICFLHYPWGPGGALALGNVILCTHATLECGCRAYSDDAEAQQSTGPWLRLGDHESAHVLQSMLLGIFFLPLYFLCGGISARNRFERAADRYAATRSGWWPWSV